jgi:hypothetical protein
MQITHPILPAAPLHRVPSDDFQLINMSSDKKRKVIDDHSTTERPKSTFYLLNAIPRHVYVVQSLDGDEHETIGIYASCEVANATAHDQFRNGKEYSYVPDEDLEESSDGQIGCVRRRYDGGLRFGASSESGTYVVWVERKELDISRPQQSHDREEPTISRLNMELIR